MSAVLISSEFLSYAGILTTFLFTVPISVKIMHIIRAQVQKLLAAMVRVRVRKKRGRSGWWKTLSPVFHPQACAVAGLLKRVNSDERTTPSHRYSRCFVNNACIMFSLVVAATGGRRRE
jgi:hypothetical protein